MVLNVGFWFQVAFPSTGICFHSSAARIGSTYPRLLGRKKYGELNVGSKEVVGAFLLDFLWLMNGG